jgi:methionyl-tRNA synthetase
MTLLQKMKAVFTSAEAQDLKKELQETTKHVGEKVEKSVDSAVKKTKGAMSKKQIVTVEDIVEEAEEKDEKDEKKDGMVSYDDFLKVEVRVGTILSVEEIEKSDKLLLLSVDTGDAEPRQIVSGIKNYFDDPQSLVGRQSMFVTNLEPRKIFGYLSHGMIFAVNDKENFSILEPDTPLTPGTQAA